MAVFEQSSWNPLFPTYPELATLDWLPKILNQYVESIPRWAHIESRLCAEGISGVRAGYGLGKIFDLMLRNQHQGFDIDVSDIGAHLPKADVINGLTQYMVKTQVTSHHIVGQGPRLNQLWQWWLRETPTHGVDPRGWGWWWTRFTAAKETLPWSHWAVVALAHPSLKACTFYSFLPTECLDHHLCRFYPVLHSSFTSLGSYLDSTEDTSQEWGTMDLPA